ncbi:hypothetical protein KAR91_77440 [Candidatus Pacearchaeota archaeon]|nr:hypothetical protein [Candidatus Pacearchaeota archaeon]
MANYAEDSDICDVIRIDPSASATWLDELTTATRDVLAKVKSDWWAPRDIVLFDEANLDTDSLLKLTVYRALGWYICPSLEKFANGEEGKWGKKATYFKEMFAEEWLIIQQLPIYDFNEDDSFDDSERQGLISKEIGRG